MARPLHIIDEDMAELRKIIAETRQKGAEAGDAWLELLTVRERQMLVLHEERNMAVQQQAGSVGVGAAAGGAGAGAAQGSQAQLGQERFRKLLQESKRQIFARTELIDVVVRYFSPRLCMVATPTQALELYDDAISLPGPSTKSHLFTQHGLRVNGLLYPDSANSSLVIAYQLGQPCVVKFLHPRADSASGVEAGGSEARANRILCGNMPAEVPLVPTKVAVLELGEGHSTLRRLPGTYAVLVMPKYVDTLAWALLMPNEALLCGMRRMVDALDWIHSKNYVHMDVKDANVLIDPQGSWFLGDLGSAVEVGSPITSTTELFAPVPFAQLVGKPARIEYDWYMLLALLVCRVHPDTWREKLLDSTESYTLATNLKASTEQVAAIAPELRVLVSDLVKRAGDLFDTNVG